MRFKHLIFLLPFVTLTSGCNSSTQFGLVDHNGDLFKGVFYTDVGIQNPVSSILDRVDNGESIALLIASADCGHCFAMQDSFVEAVLGYGLEVNLIHYDGDDNHFSDYVSKITTLQKRYGSDEKEGGISGATPSFYILNKDKANYISSINSDADASKIRKALERSASLSSVYHFASYAKFAEFCEDNECVSYLNPNQNYSSFYHNTLYPLAKEDNKPTAVFDYTRANAADQKMVLSFFDITAPKEIIKTADSSYITPGEESTASILKDYYSLA